MTFATDLFVGGILLAGVVFALAGLNDENPHLVLVGFATTVGGLLLAIVSTDSGDDFDA